MIFGQINYLPVVVGAAVYWLLGALWFSPVLFGKAWMKGVGKTEEQLKAESSPIDYVWALITSLLAAYGIARIMAWTGGTDLTDALIIAILAGVCFAFAPMMISGRFEGRPCSFTLINALYHVCGFVLAGAIIGLMY